MNRLLNKIETVFQEMSNPGEARNFNLTITNMKQSGLNLLIGELYYDENGVVRILRSGDAPVVLATLSSSLGAVTVTTI